MDVKLELDDQLAHEKVKEATMQLSQQIYQHQGEAVLDKLQDLFTNCWEKGTLPQGLTVAVTVSLYKNKGEKSDCSNF